MADIAYKPNDSKNDFSQAVNSIDAGEWASMSEEDKKIALLGYKPVSQSSLVHLLTSKGIQERILGT